MSDTENTPVEDPAPVADTPPTEADTPPSETETPVPETVVQSVETTVAAYATALSDTIATLKTIIANAPTLETIVEADIQGLVDYTKDKAETFIEDIAAEVENLVTVGG